MSLNPPPPSQPPPLPGKSLLPSNPYYYPIRLPAGWSASGIFTWTAAESEPKMPLNLPESTQEEPIRGVKCATLNLANTDESSDDFITAIKFRGVGYQTEYDVESYAECSGHGNHPAPQAECECGFWLPKDISDIMTGNDTWLLDVELAGRIVECEHVWRGQWQRVLAVQPPLWCNMCIGDAKHRPATCLTIDRLRLIARCGEHAPYPIPKPLSWLRSILGTEVKPGFLTDDPQPSPGAGLSETVLTQIVQAASGAAAAIASTPGLVPGRVWKYYLAPGTTSHQQLAPMVLELRASAAGLLIRLYEQADGGQMRTLWTDNIPV